MSIWSDIRDSVRQIILMESRIDQLCASIDRLSYQGMDHERRLIRIETMIEMAQGTPDGTPPRGPSAKS